MVWRFLSPLEVMPHAKEQIGFEREYLETLAKEIGYDKCATYTLRDRGNDKILES